VNFIFVSNCGKITDTMHDAYNILFFVTIALVNNLKVDLPNSEIFRTKKTQLFDDNSKIKPFVFE